MENYLPRLTFWPFLFDKPQNFRFWLTCRQSLIYSLPLVPLESGLCSTLEVCERKTPPFSGLWTIPSKMVT